MCASDDGDGDGDGGGGGDGDGGWWTSTPFLATWNGLKFTLENDFLFGKPSTNRARTFAVAKNLYESNVNNNDVYIIQNVVEKINNKIAFQIKEIEPEVSYIDNFSISYFKHKKNELPVVTSDHKNILLLQKEEILATLPRQEVLFKKKSISKEMSVRLMSILGGEKYNEGTFLQELLETETIEMGASEVEEGKDVYLLLESKFRDWTLGELSMEKDRLLSGFYFLSVKNFLSSPKNLLKSFSFLFIFLISYAGFGLSRTAEKNNQSILSKAFDVEIAHADIPTKSLRISYLKDDKYTQIEVVEPRYYQASAHVIKIPKEAIINGSLSLQIYATKKHHVTAASIIISEKNREAILNELKLTKAYHRRVQKDFSKILSEKNNDYLVTWPGDIVDIEFDAPTEKGGDENETRLVLQAGGFYCRPSKSIQIENGDWMSRLDKESLGFLKDLQLANRGKSKILSL